MNMPLHQINRVGEGDLDKVVTIKEAARLYNRSPHTIRYHVYSRNVAARRIGRDYLISVASLDWYFADHD